MRSAWLLSQRESHGVVDWRCLLVSRASKQVQCSQEEGCYGYGVVACNGTLAGDVMASKLGLSLGLRQ
jgi:hypothetical protein